MNTVSAIKAIYFIFLRNDLVLMSILLAKQQTEPRDRQENDNVKWISTAHHSSLNTNQSSSSLSSGWFLAEAKINIIIIMPLSDLICSGTVRHSKAPVSHSALAYLGCKHNVKFCPLSPRPAFRSDYVDWEIVDHLIIWLSQSQIFPHKISVILINRVFSNNLWCFCRPDCLEDVIILVMFWPEVWTSNSVGPPLSFIQLFLITGKIRLAGGPVKVWPGSGRGRNYSFLI